LDATNVITPLISVITSLYLDHISILGDTLEQIAFEKAGIIKPGVPVVSAPQEENALDVLRRIAEQNQSRLVEISQAYPFQYCDRSLQGQVFTIQTQADQPPEEFRIPLLGDFQVLNAVTAYAALDLLREQGFSIADEAIKSGFAEVHWPARIEVLQTEPPVIVDSAHNPASIRKLVETIDDFFPERDLTLVFGISEDKQLDDMLEEILPRTTTLITTQADHPRAMDPDELAQKAARFDCEVEVVPVVREALERGLRVSGDNQLLVVAGSIFVAASARIAWFERH
jgi:dihydrofolate synthase/folylpolyglutamate synthase